MSSEKFDSACHLSENAKSAGLGGYSKTKKNLQGPNPISFFRGGKTKRALYYRGVKTY